MATTNAASSYWGQDTTCEMATTNAASSYCWVPGTTYQMATTHNSFSPGEVSLQDLSAGTYILSPIQEGYENEVIIDQPYVEIQPTRRLTDMINTGHRNVDGSANVYLNIFDEQHPSIYSDQNTVPDKKLNERGETIISENENYISVPSSPMGTLDLPQENRSLYQDIENLEDIITPEDWELIDQNLKDEPSNHIWNDLQEIIIPEYLALIEQNLKDEPSNHVLNDVSLDQILTFNEELQENAQMNFKFQEYIKGEPPQDEGEGPIALPKMNTNNFSLPWVNYDSTELEPLSFEEGGLDSSNMVGYMANTEGDAVTVPKLEEDTKPQTQPVKRGRGRPRKVAAQATPSTSEQKNNIFEGDGLLDVPQICSGLSERKSKQVCKEKMRSSLSEDDEISNKKRKLYSNLEDDDSSACESFVQSGTDEEKRKKNNEASKKSRMKNKKHIEEMKNKCTFLEDKRERLMLMVNQLEIAIEKMTKILSERKQG